MNAWSDTLQLTKPLRDLRIDTQKCVAPPAERDRWQAELDASYHRGLVEGENALREQLLKQRAEMQELTQGLLNSMRNAVPQVVQATEKTMVSLALAVAQKLVAEMPVSVAMVEAAVRDALAQVEGTAQITVRLNRADLELLQSSNSPVLSPGDAGRDFRFLPSPDVTRGGCLVETNFGTVDARRETKFDLLKRSLAA